MNAKYNSSNQETPFMEPWQWSSGHHNHLMNGRSWIRVPQPAVYFSSGARILTLTLSPTYDKKDAAANYYHKHLVMVKGRPMPILIYLVKTTLRIQSTAKNEPKLSIVGEV